MKIDWSALGQVAVVSLVFGVGLVVLFSVGMAALSRRAVAGEKNNSAPIDTAVAGVCFTACVAAVVYGLYLLIPQFH
jgi:NADH:ubiquinone oxidoreductase subunit 6 (subunit J)